MEENKSVCLNGAQMSLKEFNRATELAKKQGMKIVEVSPGVYKTRLED